MLALGTLYLVLLIPDREPALPVPADRRPFEWRRDAYWQQLERMFVTARAIGCSALAARIESGLAEVRRQFDALSARSLRPNDPALGALETNLFQLAPWIAACPQHLSNYVFLAAQTRDQVKRQSEAWDINSPPAREQLYRLLFGTRMAMEEVMLQAPPAMPLPALIPGTSEPSATPAARFMEVTMHSGDILVSRGDAPTSALIARGNDYAGSFSHIALVHVDEQSGEASVVEAHIECGVKVSTLKEYLSGRKLRILLLRMRADLPALRAQPMLPHLAALHALAEARHRHIPYDFAMDFRDHQKQFCSEVASAAYASAGLQLWMGLSHISSPTVMAWLGSLGVRHFETQEPADLEYDPQLRIVAEWRDPATLFKAHVDDAVTDVMIETAASGQGLKYPRALLPLARIAKAYCVVLNRFGLTGHIPEGMSATAALRTDAYRAEHKALAARVLALAREFKTQRGYAPPYWELLKLVRQAQQKPTIAHGSRGSG